MITTKHSGKISFHSVEPPEISLGELLKPIGQDEFLRLSRDNQDIQIEMNKEGDLTLNLSEIWN